MLQAKGKQQPHTSQLVCLIEVQYLTTRGGKDAVGARQG